jgi:hypothetical protein
VGLRIADCQLPISDWRLAIKPIGNPQSKIENRQTHPLPRGGTDLTPHRATNPIFSLAEAFVLPYSKSAVFILFLEIIHPAPNVAYVIGIIPVAPS